MRLCRKPGRDANEQEENRVQQEEFPSWVRAEIQDDFATRITAVQPRTEKPDVHQYEDPGEGDADGLTKRPSSGKRNHESGESTNAQEAGTAEQGIYQPSTV